MVVKQYLTNEDFASGPFNNRFELTLHMIHIAHQKIMAGEDITLTRLINDMRKEATKQEDVKPS